MNLKRVINPLPFMTHFKNGKRISYATKFINFFYSELTKKIYHCLKLFESLEIPKSTIFTDSGVVFLTNQYEMSIVDAPLGAE